MLWKPVGLFGHLGPADLSFREVMTSAGLETGAEVLLSLLVADRGRVDDIFGYRGSWADTFARLGPFQGGDAQALAGEHLDWRAKCLYWQSLTRFFKDELMERVEFRGLEHVTELRRRSEQFMVTPMHMLQFNLLPLALTALDIRTVMISAAEPENVEEFNQRKTGHVAVSSADPLALVRMRREVQNGLTPVIYPDVYRGGVPPAETLEIFGQRFVMMSSWHLFALYNRLPVVPSWTTCGPDLRPVVTFEEPLPPPRDEDGAWRLAQQLLHTYEKPISSAMVEWEGWVEGVWVGLEGTADRVPGMAEWRQRASARHGSATP